MDTVERKSEIIKLCKEEVLALYEYKDEYMKCNFNIRSEEKDAHLDVKFNCSLTVIDSIG